MSIHCRTCGKQVKPKRGKLSCCGFTVDIEAELAADRMRNKNIEKALAPMFDPVVAHWSDENEEFDDYEGIPNT